MTETPDDETSLAANRARKVMREDEDEQYEAYVAMGEVGAELPRDSADDVLEDEVIEYGDRLDAAMRLMRAEADELAARDDVDAHLQDVIEGLRHRADAIESFLESTYYTTPESPEP